ncbi:MAG: carbohydrate ABC transporter permease [Chloroflexi bacterium]|nr:MAG: carbohydrate ABC transporter permease [Chloroflexota bacterium]
MKKSNLQKIILYAVAILIAIIYLIPFYIIARNALMTKAEVAAFDWILWPDQAQWENIVNLFNDPLAPMATGLKNSALIAFFQVAGQLLVTSFAAYGLARIKYRWADQVFYLILVALMVPPAAIFVQMFLVVDRLGWISTYPGLIVPGIFNVFNVFIFRQFFLNFPRELEEAGKVDGLGYFGIFWRIVLPNSTGVFIALGTISLIKSWNAFLWPLVVGQSKSTWTVQVVLSTFLTAQTINLPALFMGAAIGILPMILIFFVVQRYLVQGVSTTGLKG